MARPDHTAPRPRRSIGMLVLLAAMAALLGLVATGCGSEDEKKTEDPTEQAGDEATSTTEDDAAGDEATGDEAAADEDAADEDAAGSDDEEAPADDDA